MPVHDLKDQLARLPEQPGVYLWVNAAGETIYVGKARSLRDRVRSYLGAYGLSPRHDALLEEIARVEVIVTDSVMEALVLETNLIKQRSPRYNILLRDDKNYPYLQLTTGEAFPRVLVARAVERDGHFYAGPFLPAKLARRTMSLTHKLFGIRSCNEVITGGRGRPCLEYDIKRCLAPCVAELCSPERYGQAVADTRLFLEGRNQELADQLHARMMEAAAAEHFEQAAALRDAMRTVQTIRERQQKMASPEFGDRDVFGVKVGPSGVIVHVFQVRSGRVVERIEFVAEAPFRGRQQEPLVRKPGAGVDPEFEAREMTDRFGANTDFAIGCDSDGQGIRAACTNVADENGGATIDKALGKPFVQRIREAGFDPLGPLCPFGRIGKPVGPLGDIGPTANAREPVGQRLDITGDIVEPRYFGSEPFVRNMTALADVAEKPAHHSGMVHGTDLAEIGQPADRP